MPCYKPLQAYAAPGGVAFKRRDSFGIPIELPCGRCIGCLLERSKSWALRCVHEAQMHDGNNCFVTLTYNDSHLPENGSLVKSHFPKFIRALRQKIKPKKVRYYMCGEYGRTCPKHQIENCSSCGSIQRPHYHAILFGYQFPDTYLWTVRRGNRIYRSAKLEGIWKYGNSEIGSVTYESAAYVARYILKKYFGDDQKLQYAVIDRETGEILGEKVPEFTQMSLRPGIGETWYKKYKMDLFPHDYAIGPGGVQMPTPKYYRRLLAREDPALFASLREKRIEQARNNPDNEPDRLATREICQQRKLDKLKRALP